MVNLLLEYNADFDTVDRNQKTPADYGNNMIK